MIDNEELRPDDNDLRKIRTLFTNLSEDINYSSLSEQQFQDEFILDGEWSIK